MAETAPSDRIKKGINAFVAIADRVVLLEEELRDAERENEVRFRENEVRFRENEDMLRALEDLQMTEGVFADLEDLRRGVRTAEEIYDKWLDHVACA